MGLRGKATLERLHDIDEAQVVVTCDKDSDWHSVVSRNDIDLIYICTPWDCHASIAIEAMKQGKHVATEVPAALTLKDCRLLVETSKNTGRHCITLENCCYDIWHLGIREMVRKGLFGEITRLEGAYIHPVDTAWMHSQRVEHKGNPYPTHGFGPMCQLLAPDDYPEYLVSMSSTNPLTHDSLNDSLIHTHKGVTMLLQYDIATPRPYNRLQTLCGTLGFAQKYPIPVIQYANGILLQGQEAEAKVEIHIAPEYQKLIHDGRSRGVKNIMNYIMDRRLIDALNAELLGGNPVPIDMDIQEAAIWSCMAELTELSATQYSKKIEIPNLNSAGLK